MSLPRLACTVDLVRGGDARAGEMEWAAGAKPWQRVPTVRVGFLPSSRARKLEVEFSRRFL